jgi:hypothetical protein
MNEVRVLFLETKIPEPEHTDTEKAAETQKHEDEE